MPAFISSVNQFVPPVSAVQLSGCCPVLLTTTIWLAVLSACDLPNSRLVGFSENVVGLGRITSLSTALRPVMLSRARSVCGPAGQSWFTTIAASKVPPRPTLTALLDEMRRSTGLATSICKAAVAPLPYQASPSAPRRTTSSGRWSSSVKVTLVPGVK